MNWLLVVAGLIVHLIFFYSIFDIYFTSPLVHGMTPHSNRLSAPAKRLVLFVADGLRADKLFEIHEGGKTHSPFLRSKVLEDGSWGISHTRVPTESRPGHVALIAGFYEDVSAVTKGWKENPVEFDSVFNESRSTWSWGSPDILPMFARGASGNHVHIHMYPGESEDFAGADMSKLDTWVFEKVQEFFDGAILNDSLNELLKQDKLVFFLHLLGLDTTGHVQKPYSKEYTRNIEIVDRGVKDTVKLFESFFSNDEKTAYVFTSDHGMTDWGSHGASHPSETSTPLVCWGAGIRRSLPADDGGEQSIDDLQREWNLSSVRRWDVNQADISALMSILIGVPIPLQSVGLVPLDYLNADDEFKAESIFANALQILEQFEIKMKQVENSTLPFLYVPYKSLLRSDQINQVNTMKRLLSERHFNEAIVHAWYLIDVALKGLTYYHHYDRVFLGISITVGFVGWMAYVTTLLLSSHTNIVQQYSHVNVTKNNKIVAFLFIVLAVAVSLFLFVQSQRLTVYLYTLLPVILWHQVFQRYKIWHLAYWYIIDHRLTAELFIAVVVGLAGLEVVILSFFFRELMSVGLIGMALWPLDKSIRTLSKITWIGWSSSCVIMSVFPLLPVVGQSASYQYVFAAGFLAILLAFVVFFWMSRFTIHKQYSVWKVNVSTALSVTQIALVGVSLYVVWHTSQSLNDKIGLPLINQCLSWFICGLSFFLPLLSSTRMISRLSTISLSLFSSYLLLSNSHEGLFYLGFCFLLTFWIHLENGSQSTGSSTKLEQMDFGRDVVTLGYQQRKLVSSDLRRAYFFIYFLLFAFFGTGNIASINSFDPTSVLCFITVFDPFVMGALMLLKALIPLLLVTCAFNGVHTAVNVPTQSLFLLVLLMSDFMALHFFFLVKDSGSWLEIGTSISHYVIVMSMICFLFVLLSVSKIFTNVRIRLPNVNGNKFHKQ